MTRVVRGADGRVWTLHGEMKWRTPATADDFDHDINAGRGPAIVMLFLVALLAVVLIVWTSSNEAIKVPLWLVLTLLLVFMFFPLRWAMRRPWTVVAATGDNGEGQPTEKWVGSVRGVFNVRQQVARIARTIADTSIPGMAGPLKPVS
jgi:hypothetical protein